MALQYLKGTLARYSALSFLLFENNRNNYFPEEKKKSFETRQRL